MTLTRPKYLVAIAGSAGALDPLVTIVTALPAGMDAVVLVLMHFPPDQKSFLPDILARTAAVPVSHARDREHFERGHVYVAPPGRHHLIIEGSTLRLAPGAPVHFHTPSADPLLSSAAETFGPRAIGVILSGADANGSAGLWDIKRAGGLTLVQAPADARHPRMPESALAVCDVDLCAPAKDLAAYLARVCAGPGDEDEMGRTVPDIVMP